MLHTGDRIGDWVIEEPLGEGGMGAVYRVHSAMTDRLRAALKVLKPSPERDSRERFVREAEALSALQHPGIVRVMSFGEDAARGVPYLAMELAVGETLRQRLERGALSRREALNVFLPLASALEHAHASGIFHRDIKPANIVCCDDGSVKLVDFGVVAGTEWATLTTGGHLGTLPYLPPEVFRGEPPDFRAMDVYALGLVLYESLTGERAFAVDPGLSAAGVAAAVGMKKLRTPALDVGPSFPAALRDAIRRATSPDPRDRPSIITVRDALESLRGPDLDRRGRADAPEATVPTSLGGPAPPGSATLAASPAPALPRLPDEDRTERIPDPPKPAFSEPVRPPRTGGTPASVKTIALWAAVALAAGILVVLLLGEAEPPAAATAGASRRAEPPRRPSTGEAWKNARDELEASWIPPGRFEMGCTPGDENCDPARFPSRPVEFTSGFWLGRTEVPVQAFRLFAEETGTPMPEPPPFNPGWTDGAQPMVNVDWTTAGRYCAWAGGRLPTEAEWEYAARSGRWDWWHPWGNEPPDCRAGAASGARFSDPACGEVNGPVRVASYGPNAYGLHDLAGNVYEWCADAWKPTHVDAADEDGPGGERRVIRGGSWMNPPSFLRVSIRSRMFEDKGRDYIGFRCAFDGRK